MSHKDNSIKFWNQMFKDVQPMTIKKEDIKIENQFDDYLKKIGDLCENILDVGCGVGTSLMQSKILGSKMQKGVGFDASEHGIDFANKTCELSGIDGLSFYAQDESFLSTLADESFDGMICSNFLDVIPKELSDKIIQDMKRILKPKGYLLLKLNFILDESLIKKMNMEEIDQDTYQINGVIRSHNLSTESWIKKFDGFDFLAFGGFKRAEHLPEDRILWLQKKA